MASHVDEIQQNYFFFWVESSFNLNGCSQAENKTKFERLFDHFKGNKPKKKVAFRKKTREVGFNPLISHTDEEKRNTE